MKMVCNVLMQYSLVSAILKGIGTGILISSLKGNHGLDTFQQMDDEMVMIDGRV
jgi:alpha-acetolactate decarboxylase